MRLEDQVVSLNLAKRLKELGVNQESVCYWQFPKPMESLQFNKRPFTERHDWFLTNTPNLEWCKDEMRCAAFTIAELIEKVEKSANEWSVGYNDSGCFYHFRKGERGSGNMIRGCEQEESRFDSEATPFVNALAEWCIHLIEKGLMKP